jgi:general nucleoside transport system ATP-binding protein
VGLGGLALDEIARAVGVIREDEPERPGLRLPTVLEMRAVGCLRGRTRALDRVDLQVAEGDLHLLIGERGAGKTTVLELFAGMAQPDRGQILVRNWPTRIDSPAAALELDIGLAGEDPLLVPGFGVAESVVLGAEPGRAGRFARRRARRQVAELAGRLGVSLEPRARVGDLGLGERRLVELLALGWRGVEVLLLDEPITAVEPGAAGQLLSALDNLRALGRTLLVASRLPGDLLEAADRITVLRDGATVATLRGTDSGRERAAALLAEARRPATSARPAPASPNEAVLQVKGLWVTDGSEQPVAGVDLEVHHGEIHGVVDTGGRGPLELAEAVAGLRSPAGGRLYLGNQDVVRLSVRARQRLGLAYLPPADRPEGLVGSLRLWENAALGPHRRGRLQPRGLLSRRALRSVAAERAASVGVAAHPRLHARLLTRGERQLLALARALEGDPVTLVAACPTRGLGHGSAQRVWARLRAARDAGVAVLLATADPEELLALADRVTVMAGGKVAGELDGRWLSESELCRALAPEEGW